MRRFVPSGLRIAALALILAAVPPATGAAEEDFAAELLDFALAFQPATELAGIELAEGWMWSWRMAPSHAAVDTADAQWIDDLLNADISLATPDQRTRAITEVDAIEAQ